MGRAIGAKQTPDWALKPYLLQSLLTLLGPTLFAAAISMVLGRLVRLLGAESYSMIRPKWLTKVFLLGDLLSFLSQSGGMQITWNLVLQHTNPNQAAVSLQLPRQSHPKTSEIMSFFWDLVYRFCFLVSSSSLQSYFIYALISGLPQNLIPL